MLYLLYLDRAHHEDSLFVQGLAQALGRAGADAPPCLVVHGIADRAERLFEAEGYDYNPDGDEAPMLRDRAAREANQRLVAQLTDAQVAAVGLLGTDRGLLRADADGTLAVGRAGWLRESAHRRIVPVIAACVPGPDGLPREADLAQTTLALARALGLTQARVVCFTRRNRPGLFAGETRQEEVTTAALDPATVADPTAAHRLATAGVAVWLTSPLGLAAEGGPVGTVLIE